VLPGPGPAAKVSGICSFDGMLVLVTDDPPSDG
jgi:hypothetical protein